MTDRKHVWYIELDYDVICDSGINEEQKKEIEDKLKTVIHPKVHKLVSDILNEKVRVIYDTTIVGAYNDDYY